MQETHPHLKKPHITYLLSQYPAVSHTFFLKELLGLKQFGFHIEPISVNPPDRSYENLTKDEAREADRTWYIKREGRRHGLSMLAAVALRHPSVLFRGLRSAWKMRAHGVHRRIYSGLYLVEALLVGLHMKRRGLRHLHVHFGGPVATVGMLVSQAWGFTFSMTIHGPEEFYDVDLFHLEQKIRQARFVFCISDYCRSQLMKYALPSDWEKLRVLRLGVNPDEFAPTLRSSSGFSSGTGSASANFTIVCVGRLVPAKGQLILAQAVARLRAEGLAPKLVFVGDGSDRPHLEAFVAENQLGGHIHFRGALNHDRTREELSRADLFVLPSFAEGVPVAIMEAMAMEIPCISTFVAGIPELIRHEIDGLLVPPSSSDALSQAIARLMRDPELRTRLAASARARVLEHYNLSHNLEKLAAAFEACLPPEAIEETR